MPSFCVRILYREQVNRLSLGVFLLSFSFWEPSAGILIYFSGLQRGIVHVFMSTPSSYGGCVCVCGFTLCVLIHMHPYQKFICRFRTSAMSSTLRSCDWRAWLYDGALSFVGLRIVIFIPSLYHSIFMSRLIYSKLNITRRLCYKGNLNFLRNFIAKFYLSQRLSHFDGCDFPRDLFFVGINFIYFCVCIFLKIWNSTRICDTL